MSLSHEIMKNICGYSRAKYSTWFYYRPDHILFDVGEGISLALRNMIYGIDRIFISHNHGDHIGGLPGFIKSRASSMGDITKPLTIYYPKGDTYILQFKDYLDLSIPKLPFVLTWQGISPGDQVQLHANRFVEAFASDHMGTLSLGYKIIEVRKRLKAEHQGLPQNDLITIIKEQGREAIHEEYQKNLLVYSGDTMPLDTSIVQKAEVLLHDATFVLENDREEKTHATIQEACQLAIEAEVASLALFHFSSRYSHQQVKDKIQQMITENNIQFPIHYIYPHFYPADFKQIYVESQKGEKKENNDQS
ncbi:MBL fold metallo-hydrolase [Candidatus Uabimicrobium sp. HlEnr_7]|uniref:MBL fold metallo-hydrolase n=1 Tax=Candidatus Uabimicrobium helgolandensis TaxID=3095367 RepID=UPI0035583967